MFYFGIAAFLVGWSIGSFRIPQRFKRKDVLTQALDEDCDKYRKQRLAALLNPLHPVVAAPPPAAPSAVV